MKTKFVLFFVLIFVMIITGCAPAATPEPTPIPPTATPVPYNLMVKVMNAEGQPVDMADVFLDKNKMKTGANGTISFPDLTAPKASLQIKASGYMGTSVDQDLQPGDNTVEVKLEEDPAGLLAANACRPDEKLLYIDDFQDKEAEGWDQIEAKGPGWSIEADPANPDNMVIAGREGTTWAWLGGRDTYNFQNSVWRMKFKMVGTGNMQMNFRFVEKPDETFRYILGGGNGNFGLGRLDKTGNHLDLGHTELQNMEQWHLLEFWYFDDQVGIFLDGKEKFSWKDPNPWKGGTINLEPFAKGDDVYYYDDISVCELSAPFQPIPKPQTGRNLNVTVTAEDGSPIASSPVSIAELAGMDDAEKMTDESGKAAWMDLPGSLATVKVSAPGYFAGEESVKVQKGDNEAAITLKRDENSKMLSEICNAGESLLYYEDIQDKEMAGWPNINNAVAMGAPAVMIVEDADAAGNFVLKLARMGEQSNTGGYDLNKGPFTDAVLRFRGKASGNVHFLIGWHNNYGFEFNGQTFDLGHYLAFIYANQDMGGRVEKVLYKGGDRAGVTVINWQKNLSDGKWHNYEIMTYQGEYQIWIDGKKMGSWLDPNPIPDGFVSIANDFWKPDAFAEYDDFAVCSLTAPFVSLYAAK